ncbi:hypothetical protein Y032_0151g2793 [Ancylostoma ceylanicum]|uniref:POU domain protein n=1 Tax=Ancylostoma ceylanicum TaxID=53326 RepID=A0A016SZW7_9BILA|nr:hypothetical protein Y032_0151g2793 [Ancylostoma ceylanicum]
MEEASYVSLSNEAVILPCGPHTSLRISKPIACTGSRRRKGQPVKRKIIECDEESCNSNTAITEHEVVANDVDQHQLHQLGVNDTATSADDRTTSPNSAASSETQRFHIEPTTFAVDPSTIVIDSSNHVVSSSNSDGLAKQTSAQSHMKRPLNHTTSEECPPDPNPNSGSVQKSVGESAEPSANKPMDQMEMIRRLIMLVGSGTGGSQAAALQLLLSSGNPALTFATPQLLSDQARIAALNSLQPSCAVDGTQSDPQTVLASLLNNSTGNGAFSSGEGAKDASSGVAARANATSTKAATDAHSVLSSFISKLTADSINGDTKHGAHKSKPVSSGSTVPLVNTSVPLPSTPKFTLITPSDAPNGVLLQPENTNDSTPENRGSTPGNKEQLSKQMYKPQSPALLNPLSLTSRPVNQWSTSDMDAVLNSPLFRTLPRMSFRPPTKRKLFDGFSASTSSLQNSRPEIDDLESFAQHFKKQRIKLGYTQGDVGLALGRKYGTDFSQTTISRFEAMNLSFKNMCKLRPLLKEWLEGQEAAVANGVNVEELRTIEIAKEKVEECVEEVPIHVSNSEPIMKRRRKRTNLDLSQRKSLDNFFLANPRPGHEEMVRIANALDLERDVVRVWFCNRRQKLRRSEDLFPSIDSARVKAKKVIPLNLSNDGSDGVVALPEATEITTNPG